MVLASKWKRDTASKRRVLAGWLVLLGIVGLSGCGKKKSGEASSSDPAVVGVTTLETRRIPLFQEYVARTDAFYTVEVRPRVSGELVSYNFIAGQTVQKGRLIFQIDPAPYQIAVQAAQAHVQRVQSDLTEALAQLNKAKADVARYEPLAHIHAIPEEDLADALATEKVREAQVEQQNAEVQVQQAALNKARLELTYTKIYSPITGTIGQREVDPGNLVSSDEKTPLVTISTDNPVLVSFVVSDADYLRYFAPQSSVKRKPESTKYQLILADGSSYAQTGKFHAISRALNQQTDTLTVVLLFPNPYHILRPGEYAKVRTDLQEAPSALFVPVTAVKTLQGTKSVLLVNSSNKVVLRTIETSERQGENYIISGGLKAGDRVIVQGQNKVEPGDSVSVQAVSPNDSLPDNSPPERSSPDNSSPHHSSLHSVKRGNDPAGVDS